MDEGEGGDGQGVHARPLGRGLESVSHLFLSRGTSAPAAPSGSAVFLRPVQVSRDRLAAMLPRDWSGALEEGLRTIDAKVPCHPCGEIDVLAVDHTNRLTIIDIDTTVNDGLLLRGLGHFDWILRNASSVQRMWPAQSLDASLPPRLILLAPQFSPLLRRVMRQLSRPQIQWVRYHTVETPAGPGILLEPVTGE
jgi:hypothetical protein